jgi:E3 ubiquitin-protein ligase HERC1
LRTTSFPDHAIHLKTKFFVSGDYGKLGHGNTVTQKVPKQVLGPLAGKVVVFISAGYRHSAAVTDDGSLYTWGEGDFGRLGHGDSQSRFLPTRVKVRFA